MHSNKNSRFDGKVETKIISEKENRPKYKIIKVIDMVTVIENCEDKKYVIGAAKAIYPKKFDTQRNAENFIMRNPITLSLFIMNALKNLENEHE